MRYSPFELVERFERDLGDPLDPARAFSYERCAELDDREEFPAEICRELDALGLPSYYVPAAHGGRLASYEQLLHLVRMVARRDLTVAIGHGKTFLGAVSAWVGAEPDQAARLGALISAGAVVSWGLTEREHGSDLLAGEVTAHRSGEQYRVVGEKWLINNATRGRLIAVLARTDEAGGPRGFSIVLVDKDRLEPGDYQCLPAAPTHGIRGADISGIAFAGALVPADALLGAEGAGLEIVLKSLQLTRTLCAALSLGAADHALRLGAGFADRHQIFGRRLAQLPQAARTLGEGYADVLIGEAVALLAARSAHTLTGELSVTSAATKYLVPVRTEALIGRLAALLGGRAFLRDVYSDGRFQKLERDHRIVGIFDGNTLVNLNALVNQFAPLARGYRLGLADTEGLVTAATLSAELPDFDRDRLAMLSRHGSSVVQSVPAATDALLALAEQGEVPDRLGSLAKQLRESADRLHEEMGRQRPSARDLPAEAFELARRYTVCFAAAACLQVWLHNRQAPFEGATAGLWQGGLWLEAALQRLLGSGRAVDGEVFDRLLVPLNAQYQAGELFSLLPLTLAEGRPS